MLSPALGQHIDKIYVDHNQQVNEGEILYTLKDDKIAAAMSEVHSGLSEVKRSIEAQQVLLSQAQRDYQRNYDMQQHVSLKELEESEDAVAMIKAELKILEAKRNGLLAKLDNLKFDLSRLTVRAPFTGMVTHVYIADGSRIGSLHLWDINKKFVEMRIADQAYQYIKPGQFSEFYVDSFPGQIFRAKVHSIVKATGEAQGNLLPTEQAVSNHIQRGGAPVGRTVILSIDQTTMDMMPIGATGSAWISAEKPHALFGFLDIIGGATLRLSSVKSYLTAL
ncbi:MULTISPECIES: HlyD family secretion protein [unclassified Agarivorans]|uniref:HlyD family secretion protein n=1 Tax=unclassified Agarivorans TaxID=2636026 RepID=UPI003D7EEFD1